VVVVVVVVVLVVVEVVVVVDEEEEGDEEEEEEEEDQYPPASCSSPVLGPNISLRTPLSKILSLNSSLHVRDQVSRSHKVTGKITALYRKFI
jgi:hypothetical protein